MKHRLIADCLIAHRGDMTHYPENSLLAIQAALQLGLTHIEIDIQLSSDHVPIVIHDANLLRTTGIDKKVADMNAAEITACDVNYETNKKNTQQCEPALLRIPTLEAALQLLDDSPQVTLYVEIKRQSVETFGLQTVMDATLAALKKAACNIVIISFNSEVVEYVAAHTQYAQGWVLTEFNAQHKQIAQQLNPHYLFCNVQKIPSVTDLWQGPWKWALYDIRDPLQAKDMINQGVALIETGDIVTLANDFIDSPA